MNNLENYLSKQSNFKVIVFLLLLCFLVIRFYHINHPILDRHSWNQTTAAATAQNIYLDPTTILAPDANAFDTEVPNSVYAQEFPIFQILIALGYHLVGNHIWVARIVGISIAFIGWLFLWKLCLRECSRLQSVVILSIYTFNSHNWFFDRAINTDTGMVAMMLASLFYFLEYLDSPNRKNWIFLVLFTSLAGLFKPYGLMIGISFLALLFRRKQYTIFKDPGFYFMGVVVWTVNLSWLIYTALTFEHSITIGKTSNLGFGWELFFTVDYWNILQQRIFDQILTPFMGVFFLYALFSKRVHSETAFALIIGNLFYLILITHGNYVHNYYQLPFTPALSIYAGLGVVAWLDSPSSRFSKKVRQGTIVFCFIFFLIWSGKRAWNSFRLALGPKIVGDYIKTLDLPKNTFMLALEGSGMRYHEMLYYSELKGWVAKTSTERDLELFRNRGVEIIGVHYEEIDFKNKENMQGIQQYLVPLWTSYECVNSYGDPCFVGVYKFK